MEVDYALTNERELVELAKTDEASFVQLYNHYFPKIYGYVAKRTPVRVEAEDITSVVFLKVVTNLKTYTYQDCSFSAWIYKIATNCLIDHYRKVGRNPVSIVEEFPEIKDEKQNPVDDLALKEDAAEVHAALAKLSPNYREILYLKYFGELTNQEIAETMDISPNNAGVILYRALAKFHEFYIIWLAKYPHS